MKRSSSQPTASSTLFHTAVICAAAVLVLAAVPPSEAKPPPPDRRTYFITTVGAGGPLDLDAACMKFTSRKVCLDTVDATNPLYCGTWRLVDDGGQERGVSIDVTWDAGGALLGIDGHVRVDDRGAGSSIAGAGRLAARELGVESNFSFAGAEAKRSQCRRLAGEYKQLAHQWTATQCRRRARFVPQAGSPYVLPYPVGDRYRIGQSYCDASGSHRDSFAYDVDMPIGSPVVAVADGIVWMAVDRFEDDDLEPEHANDIFIQHPDGTVSQYAHLQHGSFLVRVGDAVVAGQQIAASGVTGVPNGAPHLHFEVYRSTESFDDSMAVSFRNADGPLDERGGLIRGETYQALPY